MRDKKEEEQEEKKSRPSNKIVFIFYLFISISHIQILTVYVCIFHTHRLYCFIYTCVLIKAEGSQMKNGIHSESERQKESKVLYVYICAHRQTYARGASESEREKQTNKYKVNSQYQ